MRGRNFDCVALSGEGVLVLLVFMIRAEARFLASRGSIFLSFVFNVYRTGIWDIERKSKSWQERSIDSFS